MNYDTYDIFTGILRMNNCFEDSDKITLDYDFKHPSLEILEEKYGLQLIAGNGDDITKSFNLLHWLSSNITHSGNAKTKATNIIDLMAHAFGNGVNGGINCAMLSHVLSGCLMAVGVFAREVKLIPCSPYDFESHRVVQVYSSELNKWVMLDSTYSGYVIDKNNNYLSILEIRHMLSMHEEIFLNEEFNYNGQNKDSNFYGKYLAKNTFCLATPALMSFDNIKFDGFTYLCPKFFDIKKRDIACLEYKMIKSGFDLSDYIEATKSEDYLFLSRETFALSPFNNAMYIKTEG